MMALREADEAAERAARESALELLLGSNEPDGGPAPTADGPTRRPGETR